MKDPDTQHTRIEKSPKITTASKNSWGGDEVDTALPRQYRNVPQIRSAEAKSMKENQLFGMETVGFQALSLRHFGLLLWPSLQIINILLAVLSPVSA